MIKFRSRNLGAVYLMWPAVENLHHFQIMMQRTDVYVFANFEQDFGSSIFRLFFMFFVIQYLGC